MGKSKRLITLFAPNEVVHQFEQDPPPIRVFNDSKDRATLFKLYQWKAPLIKRKPRKITSMKIESRSWKSFLNLTGKPFYCYPCGRNFRDNAELQRHVWTLRHFDQTPYVCRICKRRFITNDSMRLHRLRTHGLPMYVCNWCFTVFSYQHMYQLHIYEHQRKDFLSLNGHFLIHQLLDLQRPYGMNPGFILLSKEHPIPPLPLTPKEKLHFLLYQQQPSILSKTKRIYKRVVSIRHPFDTKIGEVKNSKK